MKKIVLIFGGVVLSICAAIVSHSAPSPVSISGSHAVQLWYSNAVDGSIYNANGGGFVVPLNGQSLVVWSNDGVNVLINGTNYSAVQLNYFSVGQAGEQALQLSDNNSGQPQLIAVGGGGCFLGSPSAPFGPVYSTTFSGTFGLELTETSSGQIALLVPPNYNYGGEPAGFIPATKLNLGDTHTPWTSTITTNLVLMGTTNQISFGATNTAPTVSTATPAKWISVQVQGESTVYRLPLYH